MAEPESMSVLDSDYYPMTTANKLYNLIRKTIAEDTGKKKAAPVLINRSVLTSAFKFLAYYNSQEDGEGRGKEGEKSLQKPVKTKSCLTVYSTPYKSRKTEVSTELPSYVKKMMENDASLRRLLKTGNVTISHIPHHRKDSSDTSSDNDTTSIKDSFQTEIPNPEPLTALDFKTAIARLRLQNPSKPKVQGKNPFHKKKSSVQRNKHFLSWTSKEEEESVPPQYNRDSDFDPTKFLEVSFREEESDEQRRKYKCPHCVKKFCWSTDLKRHILTHTGERPFSCEYCPANFTRKFLMQKHARKHHHEQVLASSMHSDQNGAVENGHVDSTVTEAKKDIGYADGDQNEDHDEMEEEKDVKPDLDDMVSSNMDSTQNSRPIIINVFSSVNGNASVHKSGPISSRDSSYSLASVPRGLNDSIINQISGNKKLNGNQSRKFSMLVNS
ncbi:unnamed protein product [Allacma fusca]|uniref:C2H2-type domain-containing protein n=1 Tax=Allacma fusca TaxID=39272 RepID=A0A8J2PIR2_9HEXA|nr:unnamed protein product [Allacma fusca]